MSRRRPLPPLRRRGVASRWARVLLGLVVSTSVPLLAVETGTLDLSSNSGAEIFWEGTSLGTTDELGRMEISGIPPGAYEIEIRGRGRRSRDFTLDIRPGSNRFADPRKRYDSGTSRGPGVAVEGVGPIGDDPVPDDGSLAGALPSSAATALGDGTKSSPSLPLLVALAVASVFVLLIYFRDPRHFGRGFATASSSPSGPRGTATGSAQGRRVVEVIDVEVRRVQESESRHGRG